MVKLRNYFLMCRWQIVGTWLLVLMEAGLSLMLPLFIGIAIDDLLSDKFRGLVLLGTIAGCTVLAGALRRFFDTRVYSNIYVSISNEIVTHEKRQNRDISVATARTNMASELVEFFENSFPAIVGSLVGLCGTLVLIFYLQFESFIACLLATIAIAMIYILTSRKTFQLNRAANDESEKRVEALASNNKVSVSNHFQKVIRWNIRLSDLETLTYSASWIVMILVLLFSVWSTINSGVTTHGSVLAILMYVFGYIENVVALPLFYQHLIRLREIAIRLEF